MKQEIVLSWNVYFGDHHGWDGKDRNVTRERAEKEAKEQADRAAKMDAEFGLSESFTKLETTELFHTTG